MSIPFHTYFAISFGQKKRPLPGGMKSEQRSRKEMLLFYHTGFTHVPMSEAQTISEVTYNAARFNSAFTVGGFWQLHNLISADIRFI